MTRTRRPLLFFDGSIEERISGDKPMRRKNKAWHYAQQSDPDRNPQFRRDWSEAAATRRKQVDRPADTDGQARQTKKS